jgi:hypothetical protein
VDEELNGAMHGYLEALSEGNREEADIIGNIHKRTGEALLWLRIGCEIPVRAATPAILPTMLPFVTVMSLVQYMLPCMFALCVLLGYE